MSCINKLKLSLIVSIVFSAPIMIFSTFDIFFTGNAYSNMNFRHKFTPKIQNDDKLYNLFLNKKYDIYIDLNGDINDSNKEKFIAFKYIGKVEKNKIEKEIIKTIQEKNNNNYFIEKGNYIPENYIIDAEIYFGADKKNSISYVLKKLNEKTSLNITFIKSFKNDYIYIIKSY